MNTKSNARWRSSEQNIIGAAIDLMREKEGELPTVKAIRERAQVNRSTFYAHFDDAVILSGSTADPCSGTGWRESPQDQAPGTVRR